MVSAGDPQTAGEAASELTSRSTPGDQEEGVPDAGISCECSILLKVENV